MSSGISIGKVTDAKRARYHAIVDGTAPCHSGHGKILVVVVKDPITGENVEKFVAVPLTTVTAKSACRHAACRAAIRAQISAAKDANVEESSGPRRWRRENALIVLAERFESDTDKAYRAELLSRPYVYQPIQPVRVVKTLPVADDTLLDYLPNAA